MQRQGVAVTAIGGASAAIGGASAARAGGPECKSAAAAAADTSNGRDAIAAPPLQARARAGKDQQLSLLPFQCTRNLLCVLDMDRTLLHAKSHCGGSSPLPAGWDYMVTNEEIKAMGYPQATDCRLVYLRPNLIEFLDRLSQYADIICWTNSEAG